eukprot:NODE_1282_length_1603_cov_29.924710_g1147_i0.p1 GENE.NODE_1282_length_1603_cov_29.924710_g1147_i0~~NODE_1282_length_1603_cov_29.924710_g1147_i0.p1  ORF type:complete len:299 (-),score=75.15 NODE_1282_length_1603_cov_29.924710_g1147_i0:140-1036(-)
MRGFSRNDTLPEEIGEGVLLLRDNTTEDWHEWLFTIDEHCLKRSDMEGVLQSTWDLTGTAVAAANSETSGSSDSEDAWFELVGQTIPGGKAVMAAGSLEERDQWLHTLAQITLAHPRDPIVASEAAGVESNSPPKEETTVVEVRDELLEDGKAAAAEEEEESKMDDGGDPGVSPKKKKKKKKRKNVIDVAGADENAVPVGTFHTMMDDSRGDAASEFKDNGTETSTAVAAAASGSTMLVPAPRPPSRGTDETAESPGVRKSREEERQPLLLDPTAPPRASQEVGQEEGASTCCCCTVQ